MEEIFLRKEFFAGVSKEEYRAILGTIRIVNQIRIFSRLLDKDESKRGKFILLVGIEYVFNLIAVYHEGMKCFVQQCYKYIKHKVNSEFLQKLDEIVKEYDPKSILSKDLECFKYIRDNASFHFKTDYIEKYVTEDNPQDDQLIGFYVEGEKSIHYINTLDMHMLEIAKLFDLPEKDHNAAINKLFQLIQTIVEPRTILIEEILMQIFGNEFYSVESKVP